MTSQSWTAPWETGTFLRLFHPRSNAYRREPFVHRDAVYLTDPAYVAAVVRQDASNQGNIVSEMVWLYPEEVRLLATLALSVPEGHGMLRFSPLCRTHLPLPGRADLSSEESLREIRRQALALAENQAVSPLEFRSWEMSGEKFQRALFERIDPADDLLVRGLHCLLKAGRLMGEAEFAQEAYMNVSIAREAALELIRDKLESAGVRSPSFRDAHEYVAANFRHGHYLAEELISQHDLWVETKHPRSSFGPTWMPQLMADDLAETYESLISVYRHVLSGEPGRISAWDEP